MKRILTVVRDNHCRDQITGSEGSEGLWRRSEKMSEAGERRETDPSFENDANLIKLKRSLLLLRKWSNGVLVFGIRVEVDKSLICELEG